MPPRDNARSMVYRLCFSFCPGTNRVAITSRPHVLQNVTPGFSLVVQNAQIMEDAGKGSGKDPIPVCPTPDCPLGGPVPAPAELGDTRVVEPVTDGMTGGVIPIGGDTTVELEPVPGALFGDVVCGTVPTRVGGMWVVEPVTEGMTSGVIPVGGDTTAGIEPGPGDFLPGVVLGGVVPVGGDTTVGVEPVTGVVVGGTFFGVRPIGVEPVTGVVLLLAGMFPANDEFGGPVTTDCCVMGRLSHGVIVRF